MPAHYETLKAQLVADLTSVVDSGGKITFGRFEKPKGASAYAFVLTGVDRANVGRQVQESYTFLIGLSILVPTATTDGPDPESALIALADALIMRLAPFTTDPEEISSAGPYAGVASLRRVRDVKPMERQDADAHVGVVLTFSCMATIYQ